MGYDDNLNVKITAENQLGPGLNAARQDVQSFSSQVVGMGTAFAASLLTIQAAEAGLRKLADFIKFSVDAYRDLQLAQERLKVAVEATGHSFEQAAPALTAWMAGMEQASSLTVRQLSEGLRALTLHTDDLAKAQLLAADSANVAAATGADFTEVSHRLGLALEGNVRGLREFGIHMDASQKAAYASATAEERFQFVHANLMKQFGGDSEALLGTYAEQVKLLKRNWEDFGISVGQVVVPALLGLLNHMKEIANSDFLKQQGKAIFGWMAPGGSTVGSPKGGAFDMPTSPGVPGFDLAAVLRASAGDPGDLGAGRAEALAFLQKVADIYAKLIGTTKDFAEGTAALNRILAAEANGLSLTASQMERVRALASSINQPLMGAGAAGQSFTAFSNAQTNVDVLQAQQLAEWLAKDQEALQHFINENEHMWDEIFLKQAAHAVRFADELQKAFEKTVGGLINDIASGGIGSALAKAFTKGVSDGSNDLAKIFGQIFVQGFGGAPDRSKFAVGPEGDAAFAEANLQSKQQQEKIGQTINNVAVIAGAALHASDVISGKVHESAVATIVAFTAAGASVGGWIGAVVGFVVGAVAAAFAPSVGKDYKYATFGFGADGSAYVNPNKNIGAGEANAMVQALNTEMQGVYNAYIKILLKFPADILAGLMGFDFSKINPTFTTTTTKPGGSLWNTLFNPFGGGGTPALGPIFGLNQTHNEYNPGEIGGAASAHFMEHFDNWVKNVLPAKIAAQFQDSVSKSFEAMGMTVKAFDTIWKSMQGMDPTKALQMLADLADALVGWAKTQAAMDSLARLFPTRGRNGQDSMGMQNVLLNADGSFRSRGTNDFAQSLIDGQDNLAKLALSVRTLVGPEQVASAKSLSDAMTGMVSSLITYLNQILALQKQLSQSIETQKNALIYAQITDPNQQTAFLMAQLAGVNNQIANARRLGLNPTDIQNLVGQGQTLIGQIDAIDPTHRLDWALKALDDLNTAQLKALTAMGKQANDLVANELKVLQPVLDWFKGLPSTIGHNIGDLVDPINNVIDAFDRFANRLNQFAPATVGGNFESTAGRNRVARGR